MCFADHVVPQMMEEINKLHPHVSTVDWCSEQLLLSVLLFHSVGSIASAANLTMSVVDEQGFLLTLDKQDAG